MVPLSSTHLTDALDQITEFVAIGNVVSSPKNTTCDDDVAMTMMVVIDYMNDALREHLGFVYLFFFYLYLFSHI